MAMTKKHYEAIARRIRHYVEHKTASFTDEKALLNELACDLAFDFRQDNPNFDEARFLKACGF